MKNSITFVNNKKVSAIMIRIISLILICMLFSVNLLAAKKHPDRVVDDAALMSAEEVQDLKDRIDEISKRQKVDVVVVTQNSLDGKSAMNYADDYFDYNGYGLGENRDGVLLLIGMEDRDWWISTSGYGIDVFSDSDIQAVGNIIAADLSSGNYKEAFVLFADICDQYITDTKNGNSHNRSEYKEPFGWFKALGISLVIGLVIGAIVLSSMKKSMKSVSLQKAANFYTKENSVNITKSRDMFLYSHVTKTARPKDDDKHSTHTSSSGRTHGGGGGHF